MKKSVLGILFASIFASALGVFSTPIKASAADDLLRPSISSKGTPEVKEEELDGKFYKFLVVYFDEDNKEVINDKVEVVDGFITSYAGRNSIDTPYLTQDEKKTIASNLEIAYDEIKAGEPVKSLSKTLNTIAKSFNMKYDPSVFTFTDLFDITLTENASPKLENNEYTNYLKVTFEGNYDDVHNRPVVIHRTTANGKWEIADYDKLVVHSDGSVSVYFNSLCPIAILVVDQVKAEKLEQKCCENCIFPEFVCKIFCGNGQCYCWFVFVIIAVIIVCIGITVIVVLVDKKDRNKDKNKKKK